MKIILMLAIVFFISSCGNNEIYDGEDCINSGKVCETIDFKECNRCCSGQTNTNDSNPRYKERYCK